jgi:hypothetical protein
MRCKICDFEQAIDIVVGVGPHSEKGATPYRRYRNAGACVEGLRADGSKDGTLRCPNDGTNLWSNIAAKKTGAAS